MLSRNIARCVCKDGEGSVMAKHDVTGRECNASTTHSDEGKRGGPTPDPNFAWGNGQALTAPGVIARAEGGTEMETNFCKLLVVKDAGDNATNTRRRNFVTGL